MKNLYKAVRETVSELTTLLLIVISAFIISIPVIFGTNFIYHRLLELGFRESHYIICIVLLIISYLVYNNYKKIKERE